jgi:capsular polysaccharide export protein
MHETPKVVPFPAALAAPPPAARGRRALLLQGPVGPFFARLHEHLSAHGWDAWRVTFHAGDALYAGPDARRVHFPHGPGAWAGWLAALLDARAVDVLVLFGAQRPAHRIARALAAERGVPCLCLEEGYIRPGFVTAEWGGNNAASPLAGRLPPPGWAPDKPPAPATDYGGHTPMARHAALYYAARALAPASEGQRAMFHRPAPLGRNIVGWAANAWRYAARARADAQTVRGLRARGAPPFFLIPLQVPDDANMAPEQACGWDTPRLIAQSLAAFARHAPPDARLVFKAHPMARGHEAEPALIRATARALGVAGRVEVVETGPLAPLARRAAGVATITSTSGLSAVHHGVPLLVLGRALYAHPRLAACAHGEPDWAAFFTGRIAPAPPHLRARYTAWVRARALLPGDFYARTGMEAAAQSVLQRLQCPVATPQPHAEPARSPLPASASP